VIAKHPVLEPRLPRRDRLEAADELLEDVLLHAGYKPRHRVALHAIGLQFVLRELDDGRHLRVGAGVLHQDREYTFSY